MPERLCRTVAACAGLLVLAAATSRGAGDGPVVVGEQPARSVILTGSVVDAWVASCYDPRVAAIYGSVRIGGDPDADLDSPAAALGALRKDETLDRLVKLHGFEDAGAWVSATLKVNAGIFHCLLSDVREAMERSFVDKNAVEYRAASAQLAEEMAKHRELWGPLSPEEQRVASERLEDFRLAITGERPATKAPLSLEQVQRWVACAKDRRVSPSLGLIREQFAGDPASLRRQIALASTKPGIDATAREQGFAGAHAWGRATALIVGALREHGAELRTIDLDERAADYTPDEYRRLLDDAYEDLALVRLAFGCSSGDDMLMVEKYYSTIRSALGLREDDREVQKL